MTHVRKADAVEIAVNLRWQPTAKERAQIAAYARSTTDTPERVAGYFRAPVHKVREIMIEARRGR
jgi:hypothetical protein